MWRSLAMAVVLGALVGCGGAEESEVSGIDALNGGIPPTAVGDYRFDSEDVGATLSIRSVSPFRFDLTVVRKTGGGAHGDLSDAFASVSESRALFAPAADCSIAIRVRTDGLEVRQTGGCESEGFGSFVDATGLYTRAAAPAGEIRGPYARQGEDGLTANLHVLRVENGGLQFDLVAVADGESGRHGEIRDGRARLSGNVATYTAGSDCKITMSFAPERFEAVLAQEGPCSEEAGFGAFIDVSGRYAATEGDEHDDSAPITGSIPDTTLRSTDRYDVVASALNCREGAGTAAAVVRRLTRGQKLTATEAAGKPRVVVAPDDGKPWLLVTSGDATPACYVSAQFTFIAPTL